MTFVANMSNQASEAACVCDPGSMFQTHTCVHIHEDYNRHLHNSFTTVV